MPSSDKKNVAIFASGSGSNAQKIMEYFEADDSIDVALVISNNADAGVLKRAENFGIPAQVIGKKIWQDGDKLSKLLAKYNIQLIVLAGYLKLLPKALINKYPNAILNIHPALLPAYGGKGMYGKHVHQAVIDNKEQSSGITIHYVNEAFDEGEHICQFKCKIDPDDGPDELAKKVQRLEHMYFAAIIEQILS